MTNDSEYEHVTIMHGYGPGLHGQIVGAHQHNNSRWQQSQVMHFVKGAQECEDLGYDGVLCTEHHSLSMVSGSPHLLLAAAAMRTSRVSLGTAVTVLPLYNPVRVAEEAGLLDQLSNGRFRLGIGRGSGEVQVASGNAIGLDEHSRRYDEGIELLHLALTKSDFTFEGKCFHVPEPLTISTKPIQNPFPVWVGSGSMASAERAAEKGWGLMRNLGDNESHRKAIEHYIAHGRKHGHTLTGNNVMIERFVCLGTTKERAEQQMANCGAKLMNFVQIFTAGGKYNLPNNAEHSVTDSSKGGRRPMLAVFGTPDMVIAEFQKLLNETGARQLEIATLDDSDMRMFAKEVMPHIHQVKKTVPVVGVA